jgi:segregation and condensation protein B
MNEEKLAELEALLFIHGEPLPLKKIGPILELNAEETSAVLEEFKKRLESVGRGLALVFDEDRIQLTTKPQFGKILENFVKEELSEDLTPASLEALAVVAYFAPISRSRLEYLRGVNSVFILRSLLLRGLVLRYPDPNRPNAFLYKPTFDLLKHLGLKSREELPEFGKFQELLKRFESQPAVSSELLPQSEQDKTSQ